VTVESKHVLFISLL